jgi:hypothetical protein
MTIECFNIIFPKLMLYLFRRKIFFEKYFLYFSVFGAAKNDDQRKSFLV